MSIINEGRMRMLVASAICLLLWLTQTTSDNAILADTEPNGESIRLLESSDLLKKHPACAEFLLAALQANDGAYEEANSPKWHRPDYYSGLWFPNPEAYNPDLKPPGKWLQDATFSCGADHQSQFTFEEVLATEKDTWSNLRLINGSFHLTGFWDRLVTSDVDSPCQIDDNLMASNFVLRGASISTRFEQRLCMLGCATRPPPNFSLPAHSNLLYNRPGYQEVNDCSIMVKMKLPTANNLQNRFAEGEMTSTNPVEDAMYFPPVSIFGSQIDQFPPSYQFAPEETREPSTLNDKSLDHVADVGNSDSGLLLSKYLAEYLERPYFLEADVPISAKEQQSYMTHQLLRLGPFTAYPVNRPSKIRQPDSRLVAIRISLMLTGILCQPCKEKPGNVLVSGYIEGRVSIYQTQNINSVEQKPLAVEGTWNPVSDELDMVACGPTNLDSTVNHCNWRFRLNSLLRKTVTKDTPEGAVLRSLHHDEASGHPEYFPPLRFARYKGTDRTPFVSDDGTRFNEYKYTNLSEAVMLASKNSRVSNFAAEVDEDGLSPFPAPDKGCCSTFRNDILSLDVASERATVSLLVIDEDACRSQTDLSPWMRCSGEKVSFKPKEYLRVAVRFAIRRGPPEMQLPFVNTLPHRGEGIYDPHTGQMHLVTNLRLEKYSEAVDDQVYVKIQYPATNSTHRKFRFSMKSLRSPCDPLYFTPLQIEESKAYMRRHIYRPRDQYPKRDNSSADMMAAFFLQAAGALREIFHNVEESCTYRRMMALAVAMLSLCLIFRVHKARVELIKATHDPPNFPSNKNPHFFHSFGGRSVVLFLKKLGKKCSE